MKKIFTLLSLLLTLIGVVANAQNNVPNITIRPFKPNKNQVLIKSSMYQDSFNYSEFELDKTEIGKINQTINKCNLEFTLSNGKTLVTVLNRFDIWDKDFKVTNEKGERIMVEKGNVFQGYLEDDTTARVAVSIFQDAIDVLIETKKGKYNLHNDHQNNSYKFEDVVNNGNNSCPVDDEFKLKIDDDIPTVTDGCKTFVIRGVADFNLLNYYSGSTTAVYQRIVTIFNQMLIPYHAQNVGVKLGVLITFVAAPPFDYSNNSTLLNSFSSWYYTNYSRAMNMGHLFTTASYSGVIGTAWINNICSPNQPHTGWSEVDEPYGYLVVAHEIGHNLGSNHTNSGSIMDQYVGATSFDAPTGSLFRSGLNSCGQVDNSAPTDLQTSNIGVTSAVLSWVRSPTSTNYSAYYRRVGDTNLTEVVAGSGNTVTLTGLLSGVRYEWTAQGDCTNSSVLTAFTTLINATLNTTLSASNYCPNETFSINIATTGIINSGNKFKAQISDANGNFDTPIEIGSVTSNTSGNLTATIPSYISAGSNYKIRVVSTYPSVIGNLINVVIKPTPTKPTLTLSSSNLFCNNNPVSITASNCSGILTWNSPITATGNTISVLPTDNVSYSAKCTGGNGCSNEGNTPAFKKVEVGTQNSIIQWEKSFGGTADDSFLDMVKTADGGYLLVGESYSGVDGNKTQAQIGAGDGVLIKIDVAGNKVWEKTFGGTARDYIHRIVQTTDNNFLMLIVSASGIGYEKTSASKGGLDCWIVKITPTGDIIWQVSLGSDVHEYVQDVELTSDGGYLIGSVAAPLSPATGAANGDRTQAMKSAAYDFWIFKLDANGVKVWDKIYGGIAEESMFDIQKATDNSGYFITGYTSSASGANSDITTSARNDYDAWLLKIDNNGNKLFDKTYSGGAANSPHTSPNFSYEYIYQIKPLSDGNYLIAMNSNNHAGFEKSENSMGGLDIWLMKIAPDGTKISDKVIGGTSNEYFGDLKVLNDGSILLSSPTYSEFNVDKSDVKEGASDAWVVKLDPNLNIIYSKTFGGGVGNDIVRRENFARIIIDDTDNFILTGASHESKGNRADAFGLNDAWVMKVNIPSITKPTINANTTLFCPGESITLTASGCTGSTLWSNGATSNSIVVKPNSNDNTYRVNCLTNANACISVDSDVFRVNVADGNLTLTGTAISSNKQAKNTIVSTETINSGVTVNYKAGKSILLDKNQFFEAKTGSIFKAEIAPTCDLEQGMVGYYPFNNNVLDLSNGNHNGTLNGALFTKDRFGKPNAALQFNGANQYVTLGNWFNYQEFTISYWVNTASTQANEYANLIENNHTGSRSWVSQQNSVYNNQYYFGVIGSPTSFINFNLDANTWAHITYVKSNGYIKVFKNGVLVQNVSHNGTIPYDGTQMLSVGAWFSSGTIERLRFWNGMMDDIRIYNRPLSDTEVGAIFKSESPNPSLSTGLFANYKFDGDANDVSGKGNNGTLNGGVGFTTDRFGQANKAINFDGVDDRINLANNNSISGFNEMTMSIWFKHDLATTSIGNFFTKWSAVATSSYRLYIQHQSLVSIFNTPSGNSVLTSPSTIPPNIWNHCVVTFDNSGMKLYLNGVLISQNSTGGNVNYSNQEMNMGAYNYDQTNNYVEFFKGAMDDGKLYNRALSPLEVIQLYDLEKP